MIFPKLLTRVRCRFDALHLDAERQRAYLAWIKLYIKYHAFKHPALMGEREIRAFIRHLATERGATMDQLIQAQRAVQAMYQLVVDDGADRLPGASPGTAPGTSHDTSRGTAPGEAPRLIGSLFAPSSATAPAARRSLFAHRGTPRALPAHEPLPTRTSAYEPAWSNAA
jgi:hypothetical protein